MNILEQLKSVLCDPSGKCCITGSDEDRAIVDRALQALAEQPAQRTWVDLTKEEVDSWELPDCPTVFEFVQFIEAKIKDKNI